jgi:LPXTG-site transpeptidase (sortase) family protein
MSLKFSIKSTAIIAVLVLIIPLIILTVLSIKKPNISLNETANISHNFFQEESVSSGIPINLKIPKIGVNVILEQVGLTEQGAVGIPADPLNAAWYNLGPRPGNIGSAVITGHYGIWKNEQAAIFNDLNKLNIGDELYTEDERGINSFFVVRDLKMYKYDAEVPEILISTDGLSHLNIITCAGAWNEATKSYPDRLVIFTDKK